MPIPKILLNNNSAIKLAENPEFHKRIKYINIIYYYNREAVNNNKVSVIYIPTKEQLADFLTKNLPNPQQKYLIKTANISNNINNPRVGTGLIRGPARGGLARARPPRRRGGGGANPNPTQTASQHKPFIRKKSHLRKQILNKIN